MEEAIIISLMVLIGGLAGYIAKLKFDIEDLELENEILKINLRHFKKRNKIFDDYFDSEFDKMVNEAKNMEVE